MLPVSLFVCVIINSSIGCGGGGTPTPPPVETNNIISEDDFGILMESGENVVGE